MKKKIISILITLCFMLGGATYVTATINDDIIITEIEQQPIVLSLDEGDSTGSFQEDLGGLMLQISESTVLAYISGLVAFGPRVTGTTACHNAGSYIEGVFSGFGIESDSIPWSHSGYSGFNIEGTLEGDNEDSDQMYVICAHYDSVSGSPGADDNAAGSAAVMAAAQVMSQYKFTHTVKFVCFDGEEQGLHGSTVYASNAASNNWNLVEVINGDMIGYAENDYDRTHINVLGSSIISGTAQIICDTYPDLLDLTVLPGSAGANSDHWPFMQQGYDAAMFHEYNFNNYYHSPQDTIAHMDMDYDMRVSRLMLGTLSYFAGFIPEAQGPDVTLIPPVINIEEPVEDDYVSGVVTVSGRAYDFTSYVKNVLVKINAQDWEYADIIDSDGNQVTWSYSFDTRSYDDGPLRISAVALNKKSTQSGVFNINVIVANTPLFGSMNAPNTAITLEPVIFSASASGGAPPYTYFWDFGDNGISEEAEPTHTYYKPGSYTIILQISDQSGQTIEKQQTIQINPSDETPPELSILHPTNNIYLSGSSILPWFTPVIIQSVEITIDAQDDNSGVDYLIISIDGVEQTRLYNEPYTWLYEVDGFGQHLITVQGYDIVGNTADTDQLVWTLF